MMKRCGKVEIQRGDAGAASVNSVNKRSTIYSEIKLFIRSVVTAAATGGGTSKWIIAMPR